MKRWYVVQIYAGYEEQVKTDMERIIKASPLQDQIGQVLVPSAKVKNLFDASDSKDAQLFPGYVLVEMELTNETMRLVLLTPKVVKFLGGKDPVPLAKHEVERILSQMRGEVVMPTEKSEFIVGAEVDIVDGPFAGFVGIVDKVDEENERLTIMVSIFGRMTPVELGFNQVKR